MDKPAWRTTASTYIVESPFLRLRKDSVELPDGTQIDDYFVREGRGFAIIFALTPEDNVVLIRQFRYGIGRTVLELPSGIINATEDPKQCALRELAEETGYVGECTKHLASLAAEPSNSTTSMHLYVVRNARRVVNQQLDATEDIEPELATLGQVLQFVRDGTIKVMAQVAAVYLALDYLNRL